MTRDAALRKVLACLRLASSANPNEAAAALRQAKALMEKYGLTETDALASSVARQTADIQIAIEKAIERTYSQAPMESRSREVGGKGRRGFDDRVAGFAAGKAATLHTGVTGDGHALLQADR